MSVEVRGVVERPGSALVGLVPDRGALGDGGRHPPGAEQPAR